MENHAAAILDALKAGNFFLSVHAAQRMQQRSITMADIQACGFNAKSCHYQPQYGTWRVEGKDLDGDILTVICGIDEAVVGVTLY